MSLPNTPRGSEGKRSVEELGEPNLMPADALERRGVLYNGDDVDDDGDNDDDGDAVKYTDSRKASCSSSINTIAFEADPW